MATILAFKSAGDEYALEIGSVLEVRRPSEIVPVPGSAEGVLGVSHIRGRALPVIDLAKRLGRPATSPTGQERFIIIKVGENYSVWLVNQVTEVLETEIPPSDAPEKISGVIDLAGRVIILLRAEKI